MLTLLVLLAAVMAGLVDSYFGWPVARHTVMPVLRFIGDHLPSGNRYPAGRMLMPDDKDYASGRRHRMNLDDKSRGPSLSGLPHRKHAVTAA
jgi:hypothetical protein